MNHIEQGHKHNRPKANSITHICRKDEVPYQVPNKQIPSRNQRYSMPRRPVLCMSTWTQVSQGSSATSTSDPASNSALDRPDTVPCNPLALTVLTNPASRFIFIAVVASAILDSCFQVILRFILKFLCLKSSLLRHSCHSQIWRNCLFSEEPSLIC